MLCCLLSDYQQVKLFAKHLTLGNVMAPHLLCVICSIPNWVWFSLKLSVSDIICKMSCHLRVDYHVARMLLSQCLRLFWRRRNLDGIAVILAPDELHFSPALWAARSNMLQVESNVLFNLVIWDIVHCALCIVDIVGLLEEKSEHLKHEGSRCLVSSLRKRWLEQRSLIYKMNPGGLLTCFFHIATHAAG